MDSLLALNKLLESFFAFRCCYDGTSEILGIDYVIVLSPHHLPRATGLAPLDGPEGSAAFDS